MTKLSNERMAELSAAMRAKGRLPVRPGVLPFEGGRVVGANEGGVMYALGPAVPWFLCSEMNLDLNDPATVGVIEDYARELWGKQDMHLTPHYSNDSAHRVTWWSSEWPTIENGYDTRVEAWVAAILSAPERGES